MIFIKQGEDLKMEDSIEIKSRFEPKNVYWRCGVFRGREDIVSEYRKDMCLNEDFLHPNPRLKLYIPETEKWTLQNHNKSDECAKNIIKTILILNLIDQNGESIFKETFFYSLPKEIIFIIFEQLPIDDIPPLVFSEQ